MQTRGFAIPFLLTALGVIVWDMSMMGFAAYKKTTYPDAHVIFEGVPLYEVNAKFNELVDPVIQ